MSTLRPLQQKTLPKNAAHAEEHNKALLRTFLPRAFVVREEVIGTGPEGERVRIDFWCFPKPFVIDQGWPAQWFGIETKSHGLEDQRKKAASRLVYQASRYSVSHFPTESGPTLPYHVLLYPPLESILAGGDDDPLFRDGYIFGLAKDAGLWRVGELKIHGDDFEVCFHGINRWYHSRYGKNRMDCLGPRTTRASR